MRYRFTPVRTCTCGSCAKCRRRICMRGLRAFERTMRSLEFCAANEGPVGGYVSTLHPDRLRYCVDPIKG